jgi:hypothetical protein
MAKYGSCQLQKLYALQGTCTCSCLTHRRDTQPWAFAWLSAVAPNVGQPVLALMLRYAAGNHPCRAADVQLLQEVYVWMQARMII